jgi:hypothetical protein
MKLADVTHPLHTLSIQALKMSFRKNLGDDAQAELELACT